MSGTSVTRLPVQAQENAILALGDNVHRLHMENQRLRSALESAKTGLERLTGQDLPASNEICQALQGEPKAETAQTQKEPTFWDEPEREQLRFSDRDEAIEAILDDMPDPLPETITVCGFARMDAGISAGDVLEDVLDYLDQNLADPDDVPTKPTELMKAAEAAFIAVLRAEYVPWMCEQVCREVVNVAQWIEQTKHGGKAF